MQCTLICHLEYSLWKTLNDCIIHEWDNSVHVLALSCMTSNLKHLQELSSSEAHQHIHALL